MYDFIETLILRDQAIEELYFDAVDSKLTNAEPKNRRRQNCSAKMHVEIDDIDHKYHFIYGKK